MSQITWHHLRHPTFSLCPIKTGEARNFLDAKDTSSSWYASELCLLRNIKLCFILFYTSAMSLSSENLCIDKCDRLLRPYMNKEFSEGHVPSLSVVLWGRISLIRDISGSRAFSHGSRGTVISLTPTPGRPSYHWRPDNQEIMTVLGTNAAETRITTAQG